MHTFHLVRVRGREGRIRSVWSWAPDAAIDVAFTEGETVVRHDEARVDTHRETSEGWHVDLVAGAARSSIDLGGRRSPIVADAAPVTDDVDGDDESVPILLPVAAPTDGAGDHLAWTLGEGEYRRTEATWREAGSPTATVRTWWDGRRVHVEVDVVKHGALVFVPEGTENLLDNEVPEVNGDGVQLYALTDDHRSGGWTIVPVERDRVARAVPVRGWGGLELVRMAWSPTREGYRLVAELDLGPPDDHELVVGIGVVVNETVPGRARRRGQLVLGGAVGEWAYLRGDRHDPERLLPIRLLSGELY